MSEICLTNTIKLWLNVYDKAWGVDQLLSNQTETNFLTIFQLQKTITRKLPAIKHFLISLSGKFYFGSVRFIRIHSCVGKNTFNTWHLNKGYDNHVDAVFNCEFNAPYFTLPCKQNAHPFETIRTSISLHFVCFVFNGFYVTSFCLLREYKVCTQSVHNNEANDNRFNMKQNIFSKMIQTKRYFETKSFSIRFYRFLKWRS